MPPPPPPARTRRRRADVVPHPLGGCGGGGCGRRRALHRVVGGGGGLHRAGLPVVDSASLPGVSYLSASDEHGRVLIEPGAAPLQLGQKIKLVPGHCDPTVNMCEFLQCAVCACSCVPPRVRACVAAAVPPWVGARCRHVCSRRAPRRGSNHDTFGCLENEMGLDGVCLPAQTTGLLASATEGSRRFGEWLAAGCADGMR